MSWVATSISVGAGVGSTILSTRAQKSMAKKQSKLGREQAAKLRERQAETSLASKQEIESLRTLRTLDLPAFKQASEAALIQAQKGAERMQRQRMMGRLAPDVRQAIFGGQFKQYVGREMQRLGQYAGLTQQILQATDRQQQMAMQTEHAAASMEYQSGAAALQTEADAGDTTANILGAVGLAAAQYAESQSAKAEAAKDRAAYGTAAATPPKKQDNTVKLTPPVAKKWIGPPSASTQEEIQGGGGMQDPDYPGQFDQGLYAEWWAEGEE